MSHLSSKKCIPCQGGIPPLKGEALKTLHKQIDWELVDEHHLTKTFNFPSFKDSLDFSNRIGALAEEQGHHPLIHINFKQVTLDMWTHKIDGLVESDFVFAAKANLLV